MCKAIFVFDGSYTGNEEVMPAQPVTDPIDELDETLFVDFVKAISIDARGRAPESLECIDLVPVSVAGTVEVILHSPGSVDDLFAQLEQIKKEKAALEHRERTTIEQLQKRLKDISDRLAWRSA